MSNTGDHRILDPLTQREQEVLRLLYDGLSNREIAQDLFITHETVKWYTKQIYSKLGVHSRTEAVARARELALLDQQSDAQQPLTSLPRHNLPAQITSFVGREREIDEITQLLQTTRLLTLTGPGGTGKTRLAMQVAATVYDEFEHGLYFVELAAINNSSMVADAIAQVFGVPEKAGESLTDSLKTFLHDRNLLLVPDNFEHVLEAAPLLLELLEAAPKLSVMITSREVLNLYGEHEFPVQPLTLPDTASQQSLQALSHYEAIDLFVRRARAARPDFQLNEDNAPAVAEICVQLDGLPLALELAAARAKLFAPDALLERLENRLETLTGGSRGLPARQQNLRATIDWSYDLLDDGEKLFFARLAVFQGGRTVDTAEAVCGPDLPIDVLDGLESLLNKNLLKVREGPDGQPRFTMLETIHEYARERLLESGEADAMQRRHAECFTAFAEQAEPDTRAGPDQIRTLRRLEADYDNLRNALEWSLGGADVELGLRLVAALGHFWFRQGHYADGQRWTTHALDISDQVAPAVRAALLHAAGVVAFYSYDPVKGKSMLREALALYRELGDKREVGWALIWIAGQSLGQPQEYEEALPPIEEGLHLLREVSDMAGVGQALNSLAELARLSEDYERAMAAYNECLAIARQIGDRLREAIQIENLGLVALSQGDAKGAAKQFRQALTLCLEIDYEPLIPSLIASLAGALGIDGQPERGARLFGAADAQYDRLGYSPQPAMVLDIERVMPPVRQLLDEATFEAAWAEGRAMSFAEAVAYALDEQGESEN